MGSPTALSNSSPPGDKAAGSIYASYLPTDLPYNEDFQNEISRLLLNPDAQTDEGIRVIPDTSDELPAEGISVRAREIVPTSLPTISKDELPIPLSDPRRIYASKIPGVKLTHPGGYFEGGPGLDPRLDTFSQDYLGRNSDVRSATDLEAAKQRDIDVELEKAKESAQKRMKAIEHNENIQKQIRALEAQHDMELKLQKRMAAEQKAKREAKEKKKGEKVGE
jgi:hypothetical protein